MGIVTGIVLYAIVWFMTLFVVLPFSARSQDDAGARVPGTHGSAPEDARIGRRFAITSAIAAVIWAGIAAILITDAITLEDIDIFHYFGMGAQRDG